MHMEQNIETGSHTKSKYITTSEKFICVKAVDVC